MGVGPTAPGGAAATTTRVPSARASGSFLSGTSTTRSSGDGRWCPMSSTTAAVRSVADVARNGRDGRVTVMLRTLATTAVVTLLLGGCTAKVSRETGSKVVRGGDLVAVEGP